jgi:hypothetical protein
MIAALLALRGASAQESFSVGTTLESGDFPNLDSTKVIEGNNGQMFEFDGWATMTSAGLAGPEGPQGWSLSIRNEGVDILSTTYDGTAAAPRTEGGLEQGGFVVFETVDPAKNAGKMGMVTAVVLSLRKPITLPFNTSQKVAKNRYRATVGAAPAEATIAYEDGLRGSGEPVPNNITYKGETRIPPLTSLKLTIRPAGGVPEQGNCADGQDNDGDQKTDCADEDCAADPVCREDCDDDVDNDLDGQTDCADTDCAADPACQEDCDDDVDNDGDGKTDCDDEECVGKPECPGGDTGFDLIVNATGASRQGVKNVLAISDTAGTPFNSTANIAPTGAPETVGAQGWSISVAHDPTIFDLTSVTTEGTDAGALFLNGFETTEPVDPAKNGGKGGYVSAIVLSLRKGTTLDPTKNQTITIANYALKDTGVGKLPAQVMFMDGLRGSGEPVPNILTVEGNSVFATRLIPLELTKSVGPTAKRFRRGDPNDDGKENIADPIWIVNELVREGPRTECQSAADANDDGIVDLSDTTYLIAWRFMGGPQPTAPFAACGPDPTNDSLACPEGSASSCPP